MTTYELFGIGALLIGAIIWVMKLSLGMQKFRTTTEIELGKMQISITEIKCEMANTKVNVDNAVETLRKENREEHHQLFTRVNEIHMLLISK